MFITGLALLLASAGGASASLADPDYVSTPWPPSSSNSTSAGVACRRLASRYPDLLFYPNSDNYTEEATHFWSAAAVLSPNCVFTPGSAQDVAGALAILTATKTPFGVRSGGHMPVTGAASTDDGVLIAMTNVNKFNVVSSPNSFGVPYVEVGPGLRWGQVYNLLDPYGLITIGGRVATVGTSLLLGGGISYFSGTYGWAANNVVNYELVTADSRILQVNARSYPDLFWALKGGSNNFGIVTRYDLKTFPRGQIFGGSAAWDTPYVQDFFNAQSAFIAPGGGSEDPKAAIMSNWQINPLTGVVNAGSVLVYDAPDPAPRALENFTSIPWVSSDVKVQSFSDISDGTAGFGERDLRNSFYNTALKMTPESMVIINETMITLANTMLPGVDCLVGAAVQPITQDFLQAARDNGGDAIDLDPADGSILVALMYARWPNAKDDEAIRAYSLAVIDELNVKAKAAGLDYPFIFLNDAGIGQNPYATYGKGQNLQKLKNISKRYDPNGVFQKLETGFKL